MLPFQISFEMAGNEKTASKGNICLPLKFKDMCSTCAIISQDFLMTVRLQICWGCSHCPLTWWSIFFKLRWSQHQSDGWNVRWVVWLGDVGPPNGRAPQNFAGKMMGLYEPFSIFLCCHPLPNKNHKPKHGHFPVLVGWWGWCFKLWLVRYPYQPSFLTQDLS